MDLIRQHIPYWNGLLTDQRKEWLLNNLSIFKNVCKSKNDLLLFYAEKAFLRWYNNINQFNTYIYLKNGKRVEVKKLINRYHPHYAKKIRNRMNWLMYQFGNENALMLTLTLNPSNFKHDKMLMWESINILLNEFFDNLRHYFKKRGLSFPKYIRCIEAMKGQQMNDFVGKGNPHIHICFFGIKKIPKETIDQYWPYGWSYIDSTAKGQKVRYPIHYITKYITKTYNQNDPDNTLNQSLVWFFNKNCYDHSKNLIYPLQKKGTGEYQAHYIINITPLSNQLEELDLIFQTEPTLYKIPPPTEVNT
jgi:hypothetical protein